jgi:PAS domain S-box-containing protein
MDNLPEKDTGKSEIALLRLENSPRESEQECRSLLDNAPDAICVSIDGIIVYANKAMFEIFDAKRPEDLLGTSVASHVHPSLRTVVSDRVKHVQAGQEQGRLEELLIRVDGTPFDADVISVTVTYGGKAAVQSILRDITDRKRAEEELRESEALFRSQFEYGNIGIAVASSTDDRWLRVNKRLCEMFGYEEEELLNKSCTEITYPEDIHKDLPQFDRMLAGEIEAYEIDKRFVRKDKAVIHTHLAVSCSRNHDRSVNVVIISLQDITKEKMAEHALQESETRLRFLLNNAPVAIVVSTMDGGIDAFNNRFLELMKMPSEEACFSFNTKRAYASQEERRRIVERLRKEGLISNYETVLRCYDGSFIDAAMTMKLVVKSSVSGKEGFITVIIDITERRRAEEVLRSSEETQRALMNATSDAMLLLDTQGNILALNDAQAKRFGLSVDDMVGRNMFSFLPSAVASRRREYHEDVIATGRPVHFQDERDGMWLENTVFPILDNHGHVTRFAVYSRDITERRQWEEALRLAEFSIDHSGVSTIWFDRSSRIVRVNQAACDALGYTREDLLHMTIKDIDPHFQTVEKWNAGWKWVQSRLEGRAFESHHRHKNGRIFPVEVLSSFFNYGGQEYLFAFIHDITRRKENEQQLRQALAEQERSNKELAQFAYVASHDLQEPLRMVASFVELLAKRYQNQLDERANTYIKFAVEGASRMQSLIQGLLSYSRVHTRGKEFESADCNEVMGEVLSNLSRMTAEKGATITCESLPVVKADRTQMVQLFQNLLQNAMTFHGTELCQINVGVHTEKGEHVFSVKDNGIGIEPQYFERIFAIFQRLNPRNKYPGTGIGLSICKRIAERHGGRMWVESQPGEGSTFFFSIPEGGNYGDEGIPGQAGGDTPR